MSGRGRGRAALTALAALTLAGCGSDTTAPEEEAQLSQEVTMEIASELMLAVLDVGLDALGSAAAAAASPETAQPSFATETISEVVPCALGGSIALEGSVTDAISEQGSGSFSFELRQNPADCVVSTSQGTFTVNGNPDLGIGAELTVSDWVPELMTMSFDGGYTWTGGPGSGSCAMGLTIQMDYQNPEEAQITGTMCGYSF